MKVILLQDVGGVGQRGDVKEVADGYAVNYLIPRALARQATDENIKEHISRQKEELEEREKEKLKLAEKIKLLDGARIEIEVRTTSKGGLFKSIDEREISEKIRLQQGVDIPAESIILEGAPIKTIGEHPCVLRSGGATGRALIVIRAAKDPKPTHRR